MWPVTLSGRLLIVGLVGRYSANCLIRRGAILYHRSFSHRYMRTRALMRFYQSFPTAIPRYKAGSPRVTHPSATQSLLSSEDSKSASFDLHVLSTPPAFILSQDRTLIKRFFLGQINLVLVPELTVLGLAFRIPSEKQYGSPFVRKFIKEFSGLVYCSVIKDLMSPGSGLFAGSFGLASVPLSRRLIYPIICFYLCQQEISIFLNFPVLSVLYTAEQAF